MTLSFESWLEAGIEAGYCGAVLCVMHDGMPMTADADDRAEEGDDPCVPMVRLYESIAERKAVEANHSPSVWRKLNGS